MTSLSPPIPTFSYYRWNLNFSTTNSTLVDIFKDLKVFDFCNLSNYSPEGISNLLALNGVKNNETWTAYVREFDIIGFCKPETDLEKYSLYWGNVFGSFIQLSGANGYIYSSPTSKHTFAPYEIFPYIDNDKGTIFDIPIHIFGSQIYAGNAVQLEEALALNIVLKINVRGDDNPLGVNMLPFSILRILSGTMVLISFCATIQAASVYYKYTIFKKQKVIFDYCSLSIYSCFIGNAIRVSLFIDPSGTLGVYSYGTWRYLFSANVDFSVIGTLSTIFAWHDGLDLIEKTLNFKFAKLTESSKKRKKILVIIAISLTLVDIYISSHSLLGDLSYSIAIIPGVFFSCLEVILIVLTLVLLYRLKKTQNHMKISVAPSATGSDNSNQKVISLPLTSAAPKEESISQPKTQNSKMEQFLAKRDGAQKFSPSDAYKNLLNKLQRVTMLFSIKPFLLVIVLSNAVALAIFNLEGDSAALMVLTFLGGHISNQVISILEMENIKINISSVEKSKGWIL